MSTIYILTDATEAKVANRHIASAYRARAITANGAAMARHLVEFYGKAITGAAAVTAAQELEARGLIAAQVTRRNIGAGGITYDLVREVVGA